MEASGVEQEIRSTLNRRVDLPSGGYLIFDYAEAFTVIDVNTGRFVGSRSKTSGARLEDTITKNNLEAVKEVVRQLRLRDIGGIIVIDFIDMANPKNRAQVEEALRTELERDRTKTYVVEISPLGLVEMTRQNVTDGPREVMTRKCPTCGGDGIVVSEGTTAVELERKLRGLVTPGSRSKAFKVEVNSKIASMLAGPGGSRIAELEELTKKRFFLVGLDDVHLDHFRVLGQGTVEKLAPEAPVEVGQELELKLGELGLHDPNAGVGKVDGYDISVGGAAKLVGKKVRVRVTAVMDGIGYAERIGGDASELPITAEGEAERPTRARRSTKSQEILLVADDEIDEEIAEEEEGEAREAGALARQEARRAGRRTRPRPRRRREGPTAKAPSRPRKKPPVEAEARGRSRRDRRGRETTSRPPRARSRATLLRAEEAHAARHARRPQPPPQAGRRGRGTNGAGLETARRSRARSRAPRPRPRPRSTASVAAERWRRSARDELPAPVIHVPKRDLGEDDAESDEPGGDEDPSENGAQGPRQAPARHARRPRSQAQARRGRCRRRRGDGDEAERDDVGVTRGRRRTHRRCRDNGRCPRTAPDTPGRERGRRGCRPSNEPEDDWTYTPMSEWGSLDADEK